MKKTIGKGVMGSFSIKTIGFTRPFKYIVCHTDCLPDIQTTYSIDTCIIEHLHNVSNARAVCVVCGAEFNKTIGKQERLAIKDIVAESRKRRILVNRVYDDWQTMPIGK